MNYFETRDREWNEPLLEGLKPIKDEYALKPSFNFHWFNIQRSEKVTCFFSISIGWWQAFKPWLNIEIFDGAVINIGWFPEKLPDVEAVK